MILKGGPRLGYASYTNYLAPHLQRVDTNESVVIREIRGTAANDVRGALREMAAYGAACGCKKSVYHLSINAGPAEAPLSEAQTLRTVDLSEEKLGLGGQPRLVIEHVKDGRIHLHVVWGRIHRETLRPISSSFNYRRHEEAARQLEEEFGHAWVQGAHVGRDGVTRPKRRLSDVELRQADRSGLDPNLMRAAVTAIWHSSDTGRAFRTAVEMRGFLLTRGDRRDFVLVDQAGEVHSLARRVEGTRASEIRARMSDLDASSLPSVAQAKAKAEQAGARATLEVRDRESAIGAQIPDLGRQSPIAPLPHTSQASAVNPLSVGLPSAGTPSTAAPPVLEAAPDTLSSVLIAASEVDAAPMRRRRHIRSQPQQPLATPYGPAVKAAPAVDPPASNPPAAPLKTTTEPLQLMPGRSAQDEPTPPRNRL